MEDTRRAIRQGRVLADEGLYEHAMETWKAALSGAYSSQDYAGMFVLSGNVGEACVRLATQSKDVSKGFQLLQEAKASLDYALKIVEQFSLREVLGGYKALYQGVRRAEMLRNKAEKLLDKLRCVKMQKQLCTTCGIAKEEMVLDENDGCFYCKTCYDEYYALETEDAGTGGDRFDREEKKTGVDEHDANDDMFDDKKRSQDGNDAETEFVALESDVMADVEEVAPDSGLKENDENETQELTRKLNQEATENAKQDRIRYERVELGSLADFLAGKLHAEDKEHVQIHQNSVSAKTLTPDDSLKRESEAQPTATVNDHQEECCETETATSNEGATRVEEPLVMDEAEDTADINSSKREYSIAQLLDLRKSSPIDCPEPVLVSPVRDDGTIPTPARSKATNSRKKSNSKKSSRSGAPHKIDSSQGKLPDTTPSISPLPTQDLCTAMRTALHKHQGSSDNLLAGTTTEDFSLQAVQKCSQTMSTL